MRCARDEDIPAIVGWYQGSSTQDHTVERIVTEIRDLGALHYTWVVADAHRREARAALRLLMRATSCPEVAHLRRLVPPVRWRTRTLA